jgi:transcriptional regulator with XRE-family HTH domain
MNSAARTISMSVGDQGIRAVGLRRERINAGYGIRSLSRRTGYSKAHLSALELGRHGASLDCLRKVAAALGCKISDLTTETPQPDPGDAADDENRAAA